MDRKTTLSNILCGMQKEKAGRFYIAGKMFRKANERTLPILLCRIQNCQLFGDSVEEELFLNGKGSTQEQRDDLLKMYGLFEWKERHPATLSGGQKQRLTLAVSDWIDTPILILDEPTSGLDYKHMKEVANVLKQVRDAGITLYVITHDLELLLDCCTDIVHFEDGSIIDKFQMDEAGLEKIRNYFIKGVPTK